MMDQYFSRPGANCQVSLSDRLITNDDWRTSIFMEGDILDTLQPREQRFQLKKKMPRFLLFLKREVVA